jgi:recombination protein RecT
MSNALALISDEIYAQRDNFLAVLSDTSITFEREAGFAIQSISASDYAIGIATKNKQSVINAVTNIAAIGISLNPAKKQAYLVPRDGKICLDISYMGLMDLAMNTGSIKWAKAALVHEKDSFELNGYDRPPEHKFNPFAKDRGEIVGVYVVVKTADGEYLTHTMEIGEVFAIRDRSTAWKAYVKDKSKTCPWVTDEGEMVKKTCVKQAYKYWPKTERLEQAIHHLNVDSGEGLPPLRNDVPEHDVRLKEKWIEKANGAPDAESLKRIWADGLAEIRPTKDMITYNAFKAAVEAKGRGFNEKQVEGEEVTQ